MSDLDKDMHGGRIRHLGKPEAPDDAVRLQDLKEAAQKIPTITGPALISGSGSPGPRGPQGPEGFGSSNGNGSQGFQGNQGNQGLTGISVPGSQGMQGFQGNVGPQGNVGSTGTPGIPGAQGFQGDEGPSGTIGSQGPQGYQGSEGPQGLQGFQGDEGPAGTTGAQGFQGDEGPEGVQGPQGNQGLQGFQGVAGPGTESAIGVSNLGNTSGNTGTTQGTYVLAAINHITLSQSTAAGSLATVTISGRNAVFGLGVSTGGNTLGNTGTTHGTVVLEGVGAVTLSQATAAGSQATIRISAPNGVFGAGVSTGGNTSGTTGTVTGTVVLAGGNQITLSQSTNPSGATITISGRDAVFGAGVSTGGNTSGTTGTVTGTLVLAGGNNITLSQSTNTGGATITISAGGGGGFVAGVSTGGNTSGTTGTVNSQLVLVGGNGVTLSQSTAAGGSATITISVEGGAAAAATVSYWDNVGIDSGTNALGGKPHQNATLMIFPLDGADRWFPGAMTVSTMMLNLSQSGSTATLSQSHTTRISFGLYQRTNSTQLTLVNSVSTSYGAGVAATANSTIAQGQRWLTIHSSQWSSQPVLTASIVYYGGLWVRSSNVSAQVMSILGNYIYSTASRSGTIGVNSASATSRGFAPFLGVFSASFSTAMPVSIAYSAINKAAASVNFQPHLVFNNLTAVI